MAIATDISDAADVEATSPNADAVLRLVDVHKAFGALKVLRGINLDIQRGRTTVILGPSGTGKSVLLKHIVGLIKPDVGEVWFQGKRIDELGEKQLVAVRKKIGFLFQMGALFDSMNVAENICFPLVQHSDIGRDQRQERLEKVLRIVGLEGIGEKMPGDLSGGQKKRVALARAIVLEPEVVLYDEPTTGLDPIRGDVINELILSLRKAMGITNVVVTHDMQSAMKIADRLVMLYDGKVVADGTPDDFINSEDDLVQRFIKGKADQQDLDLIRRGFGEDDGAEAGSKKTGSKAKSE